MSAVRLMLKAELLGTIRDPDPDQPFFSGTFEPEPAFGNVRAYFEEELRLLNAEHFDVDAWEAAYQRILDLGLNLAFDDGSCVCDFLLHVDDGLAWFRF